MVSMASSHFFNWVEQLKDAGHEVHWFDVRDSSAKVSNIAWVRQYVVWKLRWDYPGRYRMKKSYPRLYSFLQKVNERDTALVFEKKLLEVQPDLVHSFEMQLSCLPILGIMEKYRSVKWAFSSWGSDVFYAKQIGIPQNLFKGVLKRIDYLITDCQRDYKIAVEKGFDQQYLGVFPGNGGVFIDSDCIRPLSERKTILIKGYENELGKGFQIIKALSEKVLSLLKDYEIIVIGASHEIRDYVRDLERFKDVPIKVYLRSEFIKNSDLLQLMGKSYIYIGNSLSDGLPNTMIEAMGMGAFPIQSNPGNATAELIKDGQNGLLIPNPLDVKNIEGLLLNALTNTEMIEKAFEYNTRMIKEKYDREKVKKDIVNMYESIALQL